MRIDLQLHSTYSDGYLTPTELVQFMNKKGVRVAAITDHNTVGGVNEFKIACKKYGIKPIVGVELYAKFGNRRINLVWYNINEFNPCLHDMLRESQIRRRRRIRWSLEKLVDLGFKIKINKVLDQYTHYVPINHVVDDIMAVPHNLKKIKKELEMHHPREGDVIHEYFHNEKLNKLRESYISIERIVKLKKKIGGVLILNHPAKKGFKSRGGLKKIKKKGKGGGKVFFPHYSRGAKNPKTIFGRKIKWKKT